MRGTSWPPKGPSQPLMLLLARFFIVEAMATLAIADALMAQHAESDESRSWTVVHFGSTITLRKCEKRGHTSSIETVMIKVLAKF